MRILYNLHLSKMVRSPCIPLPHWGRGLSKPRRLRGETIAAEFKQRLEQYVERTYRKVTA